MSGIDRRQLREFGTAGDTVPVGRGHAPTVGHEGVNQGVKAKRGGRFRLT